MDITVILCTFNRCATLAKALSSVAASALPESVQWEVLVVDNNSTDRTRAVVEEICSRHPGRFRYLFEARQGKSYALNTAVQTALGDLLAFVDDDVTVEPTWLHKLSAALQDSEWAGVGGRILPEEAFSPPHWLSIKNRYALAPFAIFDLGPEAAELTEPPFGTNMAFRKGTFVKYGDFRTDIGPCPGSEIRGEDTEFGSRLLAGGERFWYEPSAIVYHSVPESRVQKKYLLEWWFDKGRSEIRAFGMPPEARWLVGGVPLFLFRRLSVLGLRWLVAVEPSRRFSHRLSVWGVAGRILECYRRSYNVSQGGRPKISWYRNRPDETSGSA
jgi:glucosyl-dolichyl phosphate glucuronosyltransferase